MLHQHDIQTHTNPAKTTHRTARNKEDSSQRINNHNSHPRNGRDKSARQPHGRGQQPECANEDAVLEADLDGVEEVLVAVLGVVAGVDFLGPPLLDGDGEAEDDGRGEDLMGRWVLVRRHSVEWEGG